MERILARDVNKHSGETISISGWLHKKRLLGGLNFISLRDRTGLTQTLIEDKDEIEKLRGLQIGTVLTLQGVVVADERAPGGAELHEVKVTVDVPVREEPPIEIDKPISHKPENLDSLFEYRVLNIRNLQEQKIFAVRNSIVREIRNFLYDHEFVEMDTPKILGKPTEGGAEVFEFDYFGQAASLAQSPQFYKQIMVGAYERVFEIGHAYRAEPSATTRHMTELTMLDVEMGFVKDHNEVLDMIGDMVMSVLRATYDRHAADLKSLNAPELKLPEASADIPRFSIAEIHSMYTKATGIDTTSEKDLIPDEERWIADYARKQLGSDLVYAKDFPAEAGKFYHKFNGETVAWADLLFRGLEIATCPLRENNYETMVKQMTDAGLNVEEPGFKYYLQAFKYGLPAHGGCGLGIDRLVQKTLGLGNVKEATLFPRDINRLTP